MNEPNVIITLIRCVCVLIAILILSIAGCCSYETKKYTEGGYTRTPYAGSQGAYWTKP